MAPYSPRSVVANRRTEPCWRRLAISTLRSTPGRPSQRSSDSPRACSSVAKLGEVEEGGVGGEDPPVRAGDHEAVGRALDHLEQP